MIAFLMVSLLAVAPDDLPKAGEINTSVIFKELGDLQVTSVDRRKYGWRWKGPKITMEDESFAIAIPRNYSNETPFGLFVYISPTDEGMIRSRFFRDEGFQQFLEKQKMIFVAANKSGNNRNPLERLQLALTGLSNMKKSYAIDEKRMIISGFSGGGRMACLTGRYAPATFCGVLAIGGPSFHKTLPAGPGKSYAGDMQLYPATEEKIAKKKVSFVFLSGPNDFNYKPSIQFEKAYRDAGYKSLLIDVPNLSHEVPGTDALTKGLEFVFENAQKEAASTPPSDPSKKGKSTSTTIEKRKKK